MKKTCLLIPGNPAVARYYLSWIEEIESHYKNLAIDLNTDQQVDVHVTYATSYVIFDKKLNYFQYELAMRKHYEEIFLGLAAKTDSAEKITIIAHSVGSYFALRLLEKFSDKIEKVIIIFPYLGYDRLPSLKFVQIPYWLDRIFPMAELVSKFRNFLHWKDHQIVNISYDQLKANLRFGVRQCTYFRKNKFDTTNVSKYKDKIDFVYTDNDRWCPVETIEQLKPITNFKKVDIPHDFIVDSKWREKMLGELNLQ